MQCHSSGHQALATSSLSSPQKQKLKMALMTLKQIWVLGRDILSAQRVSTMESRSRVRHTALRVEGSLARFLS
eukprot:scaffold129_cov87-Skeletonema_marinoi.AAC.1